ncbi:MAG: GNAT family N-acetyltransferase [Ferruginibacter sp.]
MIYREAEIKDIPQIQIVRHAVKENRLSDPALVTDHDVAEYMTNRGKGWVCEQEGKIVGFAIVDLVANNVWALFILPAFEGKGIGKKLHCMLLDWYFIHTREKIWLGTEPNSRAETFYRLQGWTEVGIHGNGEIKFEMNFTNWSGAPV